jgi:hypothetical protein
VDANASWDDEANKAQDAGDLRITVCQFDIGVRLCDILEFKLNRRNGTEKLE